MGFLDVDGFKDINDVLGHATGDRLLRSIAARVRGALRESDTVSRYGGDEFVIVLSEIERAEDADRVAEKILQAVSEPHRINAQVINITASLGVTRFPDHGRDADTLIANADAAMYDAKRAGLGQVPDFRHRHGHPGGRASIARTRPAWRAGTSRVRTVLPAADRSGLRRDCRRRGAHSLAASATGFPAGGTSSSRSPTTAA